MSGATGLQANIIREMLNFQKSMEELRMMKMVTRDLAKFKKMAHLKKFD
jgi:hypothetical protein